MHVWPTGAQKADPHSNRFHPKDDVSSSTSLKSSVQRGIRTSVLAQMPLLSQAVPKDDSDEAAPAPAPAAAEEDEEDETPKKGGKKGGGGGKGKKGGGGKGGGKQKDVEPLSSAAGGEDEASAGGESLVIDQIWPKKEALGLTKWSVPPLLTLGDAAPAAACSRSLAEEIEVASYRG